MKKTILLMLFIFCGWIANAQVKSELVKADSTKNGPDNLFGYNGKKKNDSTLITGNGATIIFHKSDNQINVQLPPGKDPFKKMKDEWDNTDEDAEKDAAPFLNLEYGNIAVALTDAYKKVKDDYKDVVSNTIQLPKETEEEKGLKNLSRHMLAACPKGESDYNEIMNFIKKHQHDKTFDEPPLPYMDYENCWSCHPSKDAQYDTLEEHYITTVFKEEARLTKMAISLARVKALLGLNDFGGVSGQTRYTLLEVMGSFKHPTVCTWLWEADLIKAAQDVVYIAYMKALYLFEKYRKDFHCLPAVTRMLLAILRQKELLTGRGGDDYVLGEIRDAVSNFYSTYAERIFIKEDFTQWPNMAFLLGLARQCYLLGDDEPGKEVIDLFQKYDRFKLSMDVDVKIGKGGVAQLAHLQGDQYVAMVPDQDTLHCLRMVQAVSGENPLVGSEGSDMDKVELKILNAQQTGPGAMPTFIGPYKWQTMFPTFIFHPCNSQDDSMIVYPMYPDNFVTETWNYPSVGKQEMPIVQGILGAAFISNKEVSRMQDPNAVKDIKTKVLDNEKQIEGMATDMQNLLSEFQQKPTVAIYRKLAGMYAIMEKTMMPMANLAGKLTFVTPVNATGPTMFDITYDGKKDAVSKEAIEYANYNVKLVLAKNK